MRHTALILTLMLGTAQADTGIDGVFVLSKDLGYGHGYGLQLDSDGRKGDWGYDFNATAFNHPKYGAKGERFQAIGMGRRFFGDLFIEAGAEWGGYESRFPDGRTWTKYGHAPGFGIGMHHKGAEWNLRYFLPDSTPNETSVISFSGEAPITDQWSAGATVERWQFDQGGERLSGTQIMFEIGYRW